MWRYIRRKLGIAGLEAKISNLKDSIPALDARNRQTLTSVESLLSVLKNPTADDSLVIHQLRSMGYCGGWKVKDLPSNNTSEEK